MEGASEWGRQGERGVLSCRREGGPLSSDWRLASLLSLVKLPAFKLEGREETSTTRAGPAKIRKCPVVDGPRNTVRACVYLQERACVSVLVQTRSE